MGKSELRNVEQTHNQACTRDRTQEEKEFEIFVVRVFFYCLRSLCSLLLGRVFLLSDELWILIHEKIFSLMTRNDFQINLITIRGRLKRVSRWETAALADVGHHQTSEDSSEIIVLYWLVICVVSVLLFTPFCSLLYPHVATHKAWEKNNKKSISNYALMFLSLYTWTLLSFLYALICNFIRGADMSMG